jgi:hypothetical protein
VAITISFGVRRDERSEKMLKMACELARQGHRLQMDRSLAGDERFSRGRSFLDQPHIHNELLAIADRPKEGKSRTL